MSDLRKAAEMALDWMERYESNNPIFEITEPIQALRQAIEQAEKQKCPWPDGECTTCEKIESKPSLWFAIHKDGNVKYTTDSARAKGWKESGAYRLVRDYYTAPPKREWVGLTAEEVNSIVNLSTFDDAGYDIFTDGSQVARIVEIRLKEKNT